ncbi:CpsD/CapB family tyrosine-protein kinase [Paenibacillus silvisoli]|uniref:CpsD/CapB family tyrosine-protein kinase n=1 Tax=Paenibacillus silvisoli TaxID=3110539 RepID=UPI0028060FF9|nr:CpsD/CapB family tyrosine-protein kinase [Paenibacillus silvisoli]
MSRLMHKSRSHVTGIDPMSAVSEAYRSLRTNIAFSNRDAAMKCVMITSAQHGEGKSTTSANIAEAYAQTNKNVLLIDADLRTPVQHQLFELSNHYGLSTLLAERGNLDEVIQKTSIDGLHVISAGPVPPNPSELLDSPEMSELLRETKERFDLVIIDTPPVLTVADALILAGKSDGVVLVMNPGKVKTHIAQKAVSSLEYGHASIIGAVLNRVKG